MVTTLKDVKPGQRCVITGITLDSVLLKRISDMGLTIGTEIAVTHLAPLGDPMEIKVRGYNLSLRKAEAQEIAVQLA